MNSGQTIAAVRKKIKETLHGLYEENEIRNFIDLLFLHLLNYSKIDIRLKGEEMISQHFIEMLGKNVERLKRFEPIQYILGETVFYDLNLIVTPDVLIPRPETEELVDWIIQEHKGHALRILDMGTGSGCIAIALAKKLPLAAVEACDISPMALEVARENAKRNHADVTFSMQNILKQSLRFSQDYHILVSNPPYVRESEKRQMHANVLYYEPSVALFVDDDDPLIFYRAIAAHGNKMLIQGGVVYVEINEGLPEETAGVFRKEGYSGIEMRCDINGKPRMIKAVVEHPQT
jgi:release factor glutamine methyltransferase